METYQCISMRQLNVQIRKQRSCKIRNIPFRHLLEQVAGRWIYALEWPPETPTKSKTPRFCSLPCGKDPGEEVGVVPGEPQPWKGAPPRTPLQEPRRRRSSTPRLPLWNRGGVCGSDHPSLLRGELRTGAADLRRGSSLAAASS